MNRPNGISAVIQRHLSRDLTGCQPSPNGISAVEPNGISAVIQRHVNRAATAEMPLKDGLSGVIYQDGLNLAGVICSFDFQRGHAASSAPSARGLVLAVASVEKDETQTRKSERQNLKGSVTNPKESRS